MVEDFLEFEKSAVDLVPKIKPFLTAAGTPSYQNALKILLTNESVLFYENFHQIVLVKASGAKDKAKKTMELIQSESGLEMGELRREITSQILSPEKLLALLQPVIARGDYRDDESMTLQMIAQLRKEIGPAFSTLVGPVFMRKGAKPFAQGVAVAFAREFLAVEEKQKQAMGKDYEDVVQNACKLEIVEPLLEVGICHNCKNWRLTLSEYPERQLQCPYCQEEWLDITLLVFKDFYQELKKQNKDLPIFISAYLKSKATHPISVYPLVPIKEKRGDIDVYVRESAVGIECKCFQDPHVITRNKLDSEAGNIKKQVEQYFKIGLKRVILVTNLSEPDSERLHKILKEKYSQDVKVLSGEIDQLLKALTELAKEADECYKANFTERFQKGLGRS